MTTSDNFFKKAAKLIAERQKVDEAFRNAGESAVPLQAARWSASNAAHSHLWSHLETSFEAGQQNIDKPVELSFDDTCLINFGTCPILLNESLGKATPDKLRQALGFLEMNYSELHSSTGVYNFEPWMQEMYRDCLDLDYREILLERAYILQEEIKSTPERLMQMGLPADVVTEILVAMKSFRSVQGEMRKKEKSGTSVIHAREHVSVAQKIKSVISRAERYVPQTSTADGNNPLADLFEGWKQSNFELMDIEKALSAHTPENLKSKTIHLKNYIEAVLKTTERCAESIGAPQCSLLAPMDALKICPKQVIEEELEALMVLDIIGYADLQSERMETRRFGPLCSIIVPGHGVCHYSSELRDEHQHHLDHNKTSKRSYDLDRRADYPVNYIVIPNLIRPEDALERIADAYLEYKSISSSPSYKNVIAETRKLFPEIYNAPDGVVPGEKNLLRKKFARYLAAFVRWARYGRIIKPMPVLEDFIDWAKRRLKRPAFVVPPRYRCVLEDFAEATPERRLDIYTRHMRDRQNVDRIGLCLYSLAEDFKKAAEYAQLLPASMRDNPYFLKALEPLGDNSPWARQKAPGLFRKYILSDAILKRAYLSFEARFNAELETVRKRAFETLGRELTIEQASEALVRKHETSLQKRRATADDHIDHDLVGLLFCTEKNYEAALDEMLIYLRQLETQRAENKTAKMYDGSTLSKLLGNRTTKSPKSGSDETAKHTINEDDFVYYNLGTLSLRTGDRLKASDYFSRFCLWAAEKHWYLFGEYAREINEEIAAELEKK